MPWWGKPVEVEREHPDRVIPFKSLYKAVTEEMKAIRDADATKLSPEQQKWVTALISGFWERFDKWIPDEKTYLALLYGQNRKIVTLAGHAYLHICYDLPVVIADSLVGAPSPKVPDARQIYLHLESGFAKAVRSAWRKPLQVKLLLWKPFQFDGTFANWVIGLRSRAWMHAESIADALETDRQKLEEELHKQVQDTLGEALQKSWVWSKVLALSAPGALTTWGSAAVASVPLGLHEKSAAVAAGIAVGGGAIGFGFQKLGRASLSRVLKTFEAPKISDWTYPGFVER